jgi:FAD/FMN-containing dehydrogenase
MTLFNFDRGHTARVDYVASNLRAWPQGVPLSLKKGTPAHQVPKLVDFRRDDAKLDVSALNRILTIDPVKRICVAESGVTFDQLVRACLRHGLMPIIVPELSSITIGGAVTGCSLESASFRYGGFHDTCLAYEIVTTAGDVIHCTPDNAHAFVFEMMHGSFGTLGVLTALMFRLIPARKHVAVSYTRYDKLSDYLEAIKTTCAIDSQADFVDGIMHAPDCYALAVGTFADIVPYTHSYDWTRVYYKSTRTRTEDYLRTYDYLFRYDRGVTNVTPSSWAGRLLFGPFATSKRIMWLANKFPWLAGRDRPKVTLDVFVPLSRVPDFMQWYTGKVNHFPLWAVPYRRVRDYPWLTPSVYEGLTDELFLDIAIYGMAQPDNVNVYREIEKELMAIGGVKTLIAHNYYSKSEFWQTWNQENHLKAKAITDPRNRLRDLYEKTCRAAMGLK